MLICLLYVNKRGISRFNEILNLELLNNQISSYNSMEETWGAGAASTMSVLAASMAFAAKHLSGTPIWRSPANKFMFMVE